MNDELFPVVDENGDVIGSATRGECHSGSMKLHPVVHLHVIDRHGRILLQRRSPDKDIQPVAVGHGCRRARRLWRKRA